MSARGVRAAPSGLGLPEWDLEPNFEANGGRVFIVEGDLSRQTALFDQLCADAAKLGNYPIDLLACVPPSLVLTEEGSILTQYRQKHHSRRNRAQ